MECPVALQWELAVYDDPARRVGQVEDAIGTPAVAEFNLKAVGLWRQHLADQIVQLNFTERAAGLFVGEDVLEAHHLPRQAGDFLLSGVDHRQPFVQFLQGLAGCFRLLGQAVTEAFADTVQALVHTGAQGGLRVAELVRHVGEDGQLGVGLRAPAFAPQHQKRDADDADGNDHRQDRDKVHALI